MSSTTKHHSLDRETSFGGTFQQVFALSKAPAAMPRLFTHHEMMSPDVPMPVSVRAFVKEYIEEFLCKSHAELGRSGPVCPFMSPTIRQNTVYYLVIEDAHLTAEKIDAHVNDICNIFLTLHPSSGTASSYKACILLFPSLDDKLAPELIDAAQQRNKPAFVAKGLMLGEFYPSNSTPGLRCPASQTFFPLRTPLPALAIRSLVSSDIVFLDRESYAPEIRASFLQSYYSRFPPAPSATSSSSSTPIPSSSAPITLGPLPVPSKPNKLTRINSPLYFIYVAFIVLLSFFLTIKSTALHWLN